jgi:hypothetical protein
MAQTVLPVKFPAQAVFHQPNQREFGSIQGVFMQSDEAQRRAEALFKKEQQSREAQQAMTEYQAAQDAMREKTARLRALRLARDVARQAALPADQKGAVQRARQRVRPKKIRTGLGRTEHDRASATARGSLDNALPPAASSR